MDTSIENVSPGLGAMPEMLSLNPWYEICSAGAAGALVATGSVDAGGPCSHKITIPAAGTSSF